MNDNQLVIRPAERADAKGLAWCLHRLRPHTEGLLEPQMVADIVTVKATNGTAVYVATHEGSVVGTYTLIIDPKVARLGRPAGFLEDVAVAPGWDGRGVGTALVRHALEMARRADCYKVVLTCREGLVDFYARMGFYRSDECYMRVDL